MKGHSVRWSRIWNTSGFAVGQWRKLQQNICIPFLDITWGRCSGFTAEICGNLKLSFWTAPDNLQAEMFAKPRAKILAHKAEAKKKGVNEVARSANRKKKGGWEPISYPVGFSTPILILYAHACGMHYTHDRAKMMGRLYVLGAMMRLLSDYISLMFSYYTKIPILMNGIFQMFFLISWEIVWADKAKEER